MRVFYQAYGIGFGGGTSNAVLLLNAFARDNPEDQFHILCAEKSQFAGLSSYPNVTLTELPEGKGKEQRRLALNLYDVGRRARAWEADLIWNHNLGPYRRTGVPQVLMCNNPHQVYPWSITRYHPDPRPQVAVLRWFFRRALRSADGVMTQTHRMADLLRAVPGCPKRVAVVPKAVESSSDVELRELPAELREALGVGLPDRPFTFLYVSTYTPHKNHVTAIRALDLLCAQGERVRLVVTISPEKALQVGGEAAKRLMEKGALVPLAWVAKEHVRSLYDACDACVMPSVLEALSSAHLEAMGWDKAQISADLPYARDLCGAASLYAQPEDPADWAVKMRELMKDQELSARLVALGRQQMGIFPQTWSQAASLARAFFEEVRKAGGR